jgi:hypothetical protein
MTVPLLNLFTVIDFGGKPAKTLFVNIDFQRVIVANQDIYS